MNREGFERLMSDLDAELERKCLTLDEVVGGEV